MQICVRLHQIDPARLRRLVHLAGFRRVKRHRFLAEHVLAGLKRRLHPFEVDVVRKRNVNRLHRLVPKQLVIAAVRLLKTEFLGEQLRLLRISSGNRIHVAILRQLHSGNRAPACHIGRSENAPFYLFHNEPLSYAFLRKMPRCLRRLRLTPIPYRRRART